MSFIEDLTGKKQNLNACLGCEIINENLTPFGGILYKDNEFAITQDFELPINGFIIISSVRHIEKFTELNESEQVKLINLINRTLNILRENNVAEEFNIILEEKKGIHFHIWLMPRHKWMKDKFSKILKNIKEIQEYAVKNMKTAENFNEILKTCEILKTELNK